MINTILFIFNSVILLYFLLNETKVKAPTKIYKETFDLVCVQCCFNKSSAESL